MRIKIFECPKESDKNGGQIIVGTGEKVTSSWIAPPHNITMENHTNSDLFIGFDGEDPIPGTVYIEGAFS